MCSLSWDQRVFCLSFMLTFMTCSCLNLISSQPGMNTAITSVTSTTVGRITRSFRVVSLHESTFCTSGLLSATAFTCVRQRL